MHKDRYIFSQIVDYISNYELGKCVEKYSGNKSIKSFTCRDQFLSLVFGQLANLKSLRGIVLCLNAHSDQLYHLGFKWAYFELEKSAVKIHTQLDLKGNIPSFFVITKAKVHDVNFLDAITFEKDAIYIMDRGYFHFKRLYTINKHLSYFIVRTKDSLSFQKLSSRVVDKSTGLRCDQTISLKHFYSRKHYPEKLRRVKYYDAVTDTHYVYLTNNFKISASTVADLYRHRWQIELFFKWIKQHLKIQVFWGYSFNAVKTQICVAISTFLLVAIIKKQLKIRRDLYEILQILQVSQFEKNALHSLISNTKLQSSEIGEQKQLRLAEF